MNLQFIRYFLALEQTQNFSQAAQKMNVVQSTFSAGIKKLEEQLDCQLFYRDKRNVRTTPEGQRLVPMAKQLMAAWHNIELTYHQHQSKELTVGLLKNVLMDAVLPRLNKFKEQYPSHRIKIVEGSAEQLKQQLKRGDLDCAIAKEFTITDQAFNSCFLYQERLMLTVPQGHELATRQSVSIKQLHNLPLITRAACSLYTEVYGTLTQHNIEINAVFSSENDEVVKGLVASGVGCALLSKPTNADPALVFIPFNDAEFVSNIVISWHQDNQKKNLEGFLRL